MKELLTFAVIAVAIGIVFMVIHQQYDGLCEDCEYHQTPLADDINRTLENRHYATTPTEQNAYQSYLQHTNPRANRESDPDEEAYYSKLARSRMRRTGSTQRAPRTYSNGARENAE